MNNLAQSQARARIAALLDENSFVEIGGMVTARATDFNLQSKETPADGVITGYGVIDGNLVYVYSQDCKVLGGAIGEMHAKKISRVYEMALKTEAPVIALVDCAGLRLNEAMDSLNAFGEIYMNQTKASGVVPQIMAIFGTCGGGMGITAGMSDFTLIADDGKLFINSPNTLDGNSVEKCDTASAKYLAEAGIVDFTGSEAEVISEIRQLTDMLINTLDVCEDDLNRVCDDIANCSEDTLIACSRIADNGIVLEVKRDYAKDMVTAFIRLNGVTTGIIANRSKVYDDEMNVTDEFDGALTAEGMKKAADFVNICNAFGIQIVTLTNASGFKASVDEEAKLGRAASQLIQAFAGASVQKVNVIIGKAIGSAYNVMNSRAIGADIVYAWQDAQIGVMDSENAVRIIYADEIAKQEDKLKFIAEKTAEYEEAKTSSFSAAKRGYVDSIIQPVDTRKYIIGALEMLSFKR